MGCTSSTSTATSNPLPSMHSMPSRRPPEEIEDAGDMIKKRDDFYRLGEEERDKNEFINAVESFTSACDLDLRVNGIESEFTYNCYRNNYQIYKKLGEVNDKKCKYYLSRLLDHYAWRNIESSGKYYKEFATFCKEEAKMQLGRKRYLKAHLYLEIALSLGAEDDMKLQREISEAFKEDDKKALKNIKEELEHLKSLFAKSKCETDEIATLYITIGKKLRDHKKYSDALGCFRRALDYYTLKQSKDTKYGPQIGMIYLDIGKALKERNKLLKACVFLEMAQELVVDQYSQNEAADLFDKYSAMAQYPRSDDPDFRRIMEILKRRTETSELYKLFNSYGKKLIENKREKEALVYLLRALDYFAYASYTEKSYGPILGAVFMNLSRAYYYKKNYIKAALFMERAYSLCEGTERARAINMLIEMYRHLKDANEIYIIPHLIRKAIKREEIIQGSKDNQIKKEILKAIEPSNNARFVSNKI